MSENLSEPKFMNALAEASFLVRQLAEPRPAGDSVKSAIGRAYRRIGKWSETRARAARDTAAEAPAPWSFNRVKDLWYADRRVSVSGDELLELQAVARAKEQAVVSNQYRELVNRIARLEAALCVADEAFRGQVSARDRKLADVGGDHGRAVAGSVGGEPCNADC